MSTFFMFGKYSAESAEKISRERTQKVTQLIEELGGRVKAIYAVLGNYDVIMLVEMPNMTAAMQASMALKRLTGISYSTAAAVPVEDLDKMPGAL
ncbi:MAG TPA: GYD domain-containing protein [Planctomycetaceae bacterium]|nr:GYD domain-containing protein [Planctomycetaceae bacterium]HIQ21413.1 GYD domain-containing protein [Planctomycetota bacterium]